MAEIEVICAIRSCGKNRGRRSCAMHVGLQGECGLAETARGCPARLMFGQAGGSESASNSPNSRDEEQRLTRNTREETA